MESKVIGYSVVAAILGIIAAATGFAAEATKVKASEVYVLYDYNTCVYPSSPAAALGIASAVFTIITRIYISVSFCGAGCCRTDPKSTPISILLFVFSWVASVLAVIVLVAASILNNRQGFESYGPITCYVMKPGIFAAGAVLALLSAVFGILAYMIISTPSPQTTTYPAVAITPVGANIDPEKNPGPLRPQ